MKAMKLIVRVDENWGIGMAGDLQCLMPEDMAFFRATTMGGTVVMGRATLETFPGGRPLKNRTNLVLTHDASFTREGVTVVHRLDQLAQALAGADPGSVFCIGGGQIYRLLLPYCDTALVTHMGAALPADTWFPDLTAAGWQLADPGQELVAASGIPYRIATWKNPDPKPL